MTADIFISYASQDFKTARTICHALENRGFKCWIASRDIHPGENFQSAIVHAIRSAKVLLLVFTHHSNRSDEMTKELALASQHKLMVVPLRVEDVSPSDAFAYEFATRQWIDLFADWEHALNQLSDRLSAALDDDRTQTDTIVLGKPSLQDPQVLQKQVAARRRGLAAGVAAVAAVAAIAALVIPKLGSKPVSLASAHAVTATPATSATAVATPPLPAASSPRAVMAETSQTTGSAPEAPVVAGNSAPASTSAPARTTQRSVLTHTEDAAKTTSSEVISAFKPRKKDKEKDKPANSNLPY